MFVPLDIKFERYCHARRLIKSSKKERMQQEILNFCLINIEKEKTKCIYIYPLICQG